MATRAALGWARPSEPTRWEFGTPPTNTKHTEGPGAPSKGMEARHNPGPRPMLLFRLVPQFILYNKLVNLRQLSGFYDPFQQIPDSEEPPRNP